MAQEFQVELQAGELLAAIERAIAVLASPRELFQDIGAKMESNAQLRFETKTDPTGAPWAPLSPATRKIYASAWFKKQHPEVRGGSSLLVATGLMRASLGYNASDQLLEIGTSRASKGGKWQIGFLHETGTTKMPRRGILVADPKTGALGAQDESDILAILSDAMDRAFGA